MGVGCVSKDDVNKTSSETMMLRHKQKHHLMSLPGKLLHPPCQDLGHILLN